ncbi:hypothetical protein BDY21DRAFT_330266 [Lineolata rhizophorae]|uniref:Cupin type-1 domain-containing protein n=1 Tax=Lineolata rhizophorae TaxID=578093 RepID=A0A6A6PDI0_9PEZI|nr:hypothetical protein BDY21DRAFT_330266 [Lineolata rhizophorae]
MTVAPEQYFLEPTPHCPNNRFPVLIYRNILPTPYNEATARAYLEKNGWYWQGTFGAVTYRHFHPNTHECYGIFQGSSTLLVGQGAADRDGGIKFTVSGGDVVVIPAGVAHCSVESEGDYRYVGVYPKGAPHWRNEYGKKPMEPGAFDEEIGNVGVPEDDPVSGAGGPLVSIWNEISASA